MTAITLLAVCLLPRLPIAVDRVAVCEINHVYAEDGRHTFDQVIYHDWDDSACVYRIRAWRLLRSPSQWPIRGPGGYRATWFDGQDLRRVTAGSYRETWTQYDSEVDSRAEWPEENRRGLSR